MYAVCPYANLKFTLALVFELVVQARQVGRVELHVEVRLLEAGHTQHNASRKHVAQIEFWQIDKLHCFLRQRLPTDSQQTTNYSVQQCIFNYAVEEREQRTVRHLCKREL